MLIQCPECDLQVSDQAHSCPHCGYPIRPYTTNRYRSHAVHNTNKRMRLPNGFGQITEIKKKNLRKPYRVMVTVGKTDEGKPICKLLKPEAYFSTYNDAYAALIEYNKNPYDLDDDLSVQDLYNKWQPYYFEKLSSKSSERTITSAWAYCTPVLNMRAKDLRARHIKGCMDLAPSNNMRFRVKSLFNLMLDYALEYELVDRNYARTFGLSDTELKEDDVKKEHISFAEEEMVKMWANKNNEIVSWILLQCYTGWRPQELCRIKLTDVDFDKNIITGGMKTDAGKNRVVPIHSCMIENAKKIWELSNSRGCEYLLSDTDGSPMTYDKYNKRFAKVRNELGLDKGHRPHDPRKHFVTMCKNANVDEYAIKRMVGHNITDITENIYTDRDLNWLKNELEKVKGPVV